MPADTWTCPPGVTSVFVECWGASADGTVGTGGAGGGHSQGGGGNAYARDLLTVIPGTVYNVFWGLRNGAFFTWFGSVTPATPPQVIASCTGPDNRPGADVATCVGSVKFGGGDGGQSAGDGTGLGINAGGGGGGAGRTAIGSNATDGSVGGPGTGGASVGGGSGAGGNGGAGGAGTGDGVAGGVTGGGGGGAGAHFVAGWTSGAVGAGVDGGIYIWNATGGGNFATVSADAGNILATFGSVPPAPPMSILTQTGALTLTGFAPTISVGVDVHPGTGSVTMAGKSPTVVFSVSPKFRKRAFVM